MAISKLSWKWLHKRTKAINRLFDLIGREIATLVNEYKSTGKYETDMVDGTAEVYTALTSKFELGVLLNKYGVGFDGNVQAMKSNTTKWDIEKGTIEEIKSPALYAKGELKTTFGFVSATTEYEVDPMLTAKTASKVNISGGGGTMPDLSLSIVGNEVTSPPSKK